MSGLSSIVLNETFNTSSLLLDAPKALFESIFEHNAAGIFIVNSQRNIVLINNRACQILGYDSVELVGKNAVYIHTSVESYQTFGQHFQNAKKGSQVEIEYPFKKKNGDTVWCEFLGKNITINNETYVIWSVVDIHQRKLTEQRLSESLHNFDNLAQSVPGIIYQFQLFPDGRSAFPFASKHIIEIFELTPESIYTDASPALARIHPEDKEKFLQSIEQSAKNLTGWSCDYRVQLPRQGVKWLSGRATPEKRPDGSILWHGYTADITKRINAELALQEAQHKLEVLNEELKKRNIVLKEMALLDGLTHIPNRRFFDEMYNTSYLNHIRRKQSLAVIMIDIDLFKQYNDYYGHTCGDDCLRTVAGALKHALNHANDIVARYGGEEFVVLLENISWHQAIDIGEKLIQAVSMCNIAHADSYVSDHVTISAGLAYSDAQQPIAKSALLVKADKALYQAKNNGRNRLAY